MSSMAKPARAGPGRQAALVILAVMALVALAGHFVGDAACLALPPEAAPRCAASFQNGPSASQNATCSWHTGMAPAVLPIIVTPLLLLARHNRVRPRAFFAAFAPPFQPPIAHLTA